MTLMLKKFGFPQMFFNADGSGSGGDGVVVPDAGTAKTAESILFPADGVKVDDKPVTPEGGAKVEDWKEFEPDAAKTDEENAAAKLEHDKTKPDAKAVDAADKVPEDGKYDLNMPEGVEVDQVLVDALGPEFKEIGLTNGQAQKLSDTFAKIMMGRETEKVEGWGKTIAGWAEAAEKDPEMGGSKWDASKGSAIKAINSLGTPELKEYLNSSGGGNHPEVIRFMAKVGSMIKEDDPARTGAEGGGKPAEASHVLFPNDVPKGK